MAGNYVLGSATVTNAPWRLQLTCQGDSFTSLASAYGVPWQQIPAKQPGMAGKSVTKKNVQNWIKSLPGWDRYSGLRPYSASDNPGTTGPDGKPEGYAQFTDRTMIMLPDMPRLDGRRSGNAPSAEGSPGPGSGGSVVGGEVSEAGLHPGVVVVGGIAFLALLWAGKRAKKKRGQAKRAA